MSGFFSDCAGSAIAVTPSDTTNLSKVSVLYIGSSGDVTVNTAGGELVTFAGFQAGGILPVRVIRVLATGTTATNILSLV